MDKYLLVILIFMIVTIAISFFNPNTGEIHFIPQLFYVGIGGIIIILLYSSYKERKERQKTNAKRRARK